MKTALLLLFAAAGLCAVTAVVTSKFIDHRQESQTVRWYNHERFRAEGGAPGGLVFNIGSKNYEFGIRADGVVIVREYKDENRLPEQINAKYPAFRN